KNTTMGAKNVHCINLLHHLCQWLENEGNTHATQASGIRIKRILKYIYRTSSWKKNTASTITMSARNTATNTMLTSGVRMAASELPLLPWMAVEPLGELRVTPSSVRPRNPRCGVKAPASACAKLKKPVTPPLPPPG